MMKNLRRRHFLQLGATSASGIALAGDRPTGGLVTDSAQIDAAVQGFRADAFNMVGVFEADWLLDARFERLLDTMAASPGAFGGVRFFGALSAGQHDRVFPTGGGTTWSRPEGPMDFTLALGALTALTERGLVPFIGLTFFPQAVSPSPTEPPASLTGWQELVRGFLDALAARFGRAAIANWWFEVWNEPNMPNFWRGSFEQYLDLYRATSAAVAGYGIRLGGPAIAYMPDEGPLLMERFLQFLRADPGLLCSFISFHRKGSWTDAEPVPLLQRSIEAAETTARAALRLVPGRCRDLWIINNEPTCWLASTGRMSLE